jgi:DNA repair ATPase RecN
MPGGAMLRGLTIRDMLLVDRLELEFRPGLNVLTGETGAGKSILLDCLGFVLGWRTRSDVLRSGADRGEVEAVFDLPAGHPAHAVLDDAGIAPGDALVLRREARPDGRRTAWVNDRRVAAETLRALGDTLVELHGQHDDKGLLNPRGHRVLLDDFAGTATQLDETRRAWRGLAQAQAARTALVDKLVADASMPVPESALEAEVHRHLEQENRLEDVEHRAEVVESTEKSLRTQFILDKLSESLDVQVSQDELTSYLIQAAGNYGMEPGEFIQSVDRAGQLPQMVSEVSRAKSLTMALQKVTIKDTAGKSVDLSEFLKVSAGGPAFTLPEETHDHDHEH